MIFLIDASDSTNQNDFDVSIDFIRDIVRKLDISVDNTRVGLSSISDVGTTVVKLSDYSDKGYLLNAIDQDPSYSGSSSDLGAALRNVRVEGFTEENGARPRIPDILVMVASDQLTMEGGSVAQEVAQLKESGVIILMALYGSSRSEDETKRITAGIVSFPQTETLFTADRVDYLVTVEDSLSVKLCTEIPGLFFITLTDQMNPSL